MIIGQQLMNLNCLFLYLIKVLIVVRSEWWCHETLEICLVLIIIIALLYYNLPHPEFNSADFKDFSATHLKLIVSVGNIIADNDPQFLLIILFQVFVIHKDRVMILGGERLT